jgi:hypothetical protein
MVLICRVLVRDRRASARELARMIGVPERTLQQAVSGSSWRHWPGAVTRGTSNWWLRGERSPNAKLTEADARAIYAVRGELTGPEVARLYGVSPTVIYRIWARKAWAWIHEEGGDAAA